MRVEDCRIIDLPKIPDPRGNLTFIESERHVPFEIKRAFFLYDVPGGESRGGHANRELEQLIIAASGSFEVILKDGISVRTERLNRPYFGLYIPGMIWRELVDFSSGGCCLVLASDYYDPSDYYQDFESFARANQ